MNINIERVVVKDFQGYGGGIMYAELGYMELNSMYFHDFVYLGKILQTVMHEIRHKQQYDACFTDKDFGIDRETIDAWSSNWYDYVSQADDFEGYMKRPIERDARDFAEETMIKAGLGLQIYDFDHNKWVTVSAGAEG